MPDFFKRSDWTALNLLTTPGDILEVGKETQNWSERFVVEWAKEVTNA